MKKGLLLFIAVLILSPIIACASGSYVAGDLTKTAISDSLEQGNQVHFQVNFRGMEAESSVYQAALNSLLSRILIEGIAYQRDGKLFEHLTIGVEDIRLLDVVAVQSEDGSVRFRTNLTDEFVFSVPGMSGEEFNVLEMLYDTSGIRSIDDGFDDLPVMQRLRITISELTMLMTQTVLGWVSNNQIDTDGELYTFDFTYLEPTETRSGVAQRMIGTIYGDKFCELLWDVSSIIDGQCGKFQVALTDVMAENGVTRMQIRSITDSLFPDIPIDPAEDYVEPTHAIVDGNAPCTYGDISYFFKKLCKYTDKLWEESQGTLGLVVSYDDYGEMVGLDAVLPKFTESLPYEGTFTYSTLTDDDWQVLTTSHGELKIDNERRIIGDYRHMNGEDVEGHNGNTFDADLAVYEPSGDAKTGFGISAEWTYDTGMDEKVYTEQTAGNGKVLIHLGTDDMELISAQMNGLMKTTGTDFEFTGNADVAFLSTQSVSVIISMTQETADENVVVEGNVVDVTNIDKTVIDEIKNKIQSNAFMLLFSLMNNENIKTDLEAMVND